MESNVKNKKQQAMPKSEAESFGIKRAAIKKKIGNLIDSMLCDDSQISEMDNTKNETGAFDINEFV